MSEKYNTPSFLNIDRLGVIIEGVFGISMTLMVLTFDFPEKNLSPEQLYIFLRENFNNISLYCISFILLTSYWLANNHQFKHYLKTDKKHLWLNLLYIMFIILVPYINALQSYYPDAIIIQILYSIDMFLIGLCSYACWCYATDKHRLVKPDLDIKIIKWVKKITLVEPIVALIALAGAFISTELWSLLLLLAPVIFGYMETIKTKKNVHDDSNINLLRLGLLTDNIFIFAMILIIIKFDLPQKGLNNEKLYAFIIEQIHNIGIFILNFIILSFFWISHNNQFKFYKSTNETFIWINIIYLLTIVLIPYSNVLCIIIPDSYILKIIFSILIFLVGMLSFTSWVYGAGNNRLVKPDFPSKLIVSIRNRTLVEPVVALISIIAALINPILWYVTFILIPVLAIKFDGKIHSDMDLI